jgi:tetratricopeptide (TPR) repeat protein
MRCGVRNHLGWCCILLLSAACASPEERAQRHLQNAKSFQDDGRHAEAVIELKNVLALDPNHADAHYRMSLSLLARGELREGYWELREAIRLDPSNLEARLKYGDLSLRGGDGEQALSQAEAALEARPEEIRARLLRAQALVRLGRFDEAEQALREAIQDFPDEGAPRFLLANLYMAQRRPRAAEPLLREFTEVEPSFASFTALASFLARQPGRDAEAEAAYVKARDLAAAEQKKLAYRLLANYYYAGQRYDAAERVLVEAVDDLPEDGDAILLLARFHASRGDDLRAEQVIAQAIEARPNEVAPHLVRSSYRARKGDLTGAMAAVDAALRVDEKSVRARVLKAELLIDLGARTQDSAPLEEARAIADAVLAEQPDTVEALFVRARLNLADEDFEAAALELRRVVDRKPEWAQAHALLGSALYGRGDRDGATAAASRAVEIDANLPEARKLLVGLYAVRGDHERSVQMGQELLRQRPDDRATALMVAQGLLRLRQPNRALEVLTAVPEDQQTAEVLAARGRIHLLQGQLSEARRFYAAADAAIPNQPATLEALLKLDRASGDLKPAIERIDAAVEQQPGDAKLLHLQGITYALAGRGEEAEAKFRTAIELEPGEIAPYQSLALQLIRSGRRSEAIEAYEQAAEERPDLASLQLVLAVLHELSGELSKARDRYERAIQLDPNLFAPRNNLAYLLAEEDRDLDRALELAQDAKRLRPDSGAAADTLGWILYKKGLPLVAVAYLQEAEGRFQTNDSSLGVVRHHLALAQEANGDSEAARATLRRALADLENAKELHSKQTGRDAADPAWATPVREMLERLERVSASENEAAPPRG